MLPRSIAKKHNVAPVRTDSDSIYIAMADPLNFVAIDEVRMSSKRKVVPMLAASDAITRVITDLYGSETAEKALQELRGTEDDST